MLQGLAFRRTVLPLLLAVAALVILNVGLYTRLRAVGAAEPIAFPYSAGFAAGENAQYEVFGGDWEVRDETLVQLSTSGYDLGIYIPLDIPPEQPYQFTTRIRFAGGTMGGGILFNAQQTSGRSNSHMARLNVDNGSVYLIYGYFDETGFQGQGGAPVNIAPDDANWHTLGAQISGATFNLTFDDQVVAAGVPLQFTGGAVGMITSTSQMAYDDIAVQPFAGTTEQSQTPELTAQVTEVVQPQPTPAASLPTAEASTNYTMVFSDSFDGSASESNWVPYSGAWNFEDGALVQTNASGFDYSAGSVQALDALRRFSVTLRHRQGVGGGVLFNMAQPDSRNGATMVRYIQEANGVALTWGNFDANGLFVGVNGAAVPAPADAAHVLEITLNGSAYSIHLDGTVIAENIPYEPHGTHIGLTASQSVVAFESVEVFTALDTAPATAVPSTTQLDLSVITGTWVNENGIITQTSDAASDAITGIGIAAETFTFNVSIVLPEGVADAGAGIVFHMSGRDNPAGGEMLRFGSGGTEIFWGSYDETRAFQGQGGTGVQITPGQPHALTVVVHAGLFDIAVDGQTVATAVPLTSQSGWIGLVSFRGPVVFSNVSLTLGAS